MHSTRPTPTTDWSPASVFDWLEGRWTLSRSIVSIATMDGIAEYTRQHADSLQYQERGRVSLATGGSHAAHRRYRFARRSQGFSVWLVDDGLERLLHDVDLDRRARGLVGAGMHECGCDRYESAYRFDRNDSFVVQHVVRGPRKDYTSITTYTRSR